jgi:ferrochelatase
MADGDRKSAVLLLNMGGPDSLDAVRPFLINLFSDPAIIGLPRPLRLPLARFIGTRRARKVRPRYALIGGRSPIGEITARQGRCLARSLGKRELQLTGVFPAFSYWHPFIAEATRSAVETGCRKLVALSLYPQYCRATTGTCVNDLSRNLPGTPFETTTRIIDSWPDHPGYLGALAETVNDALANLPGEERDDAVILFSAHGVPESLIQGGDPYLDETLRTVSGVVDRLGNRPHVLAFQSRLGPVKWIGPSLRESLHTLADKGAPPLVVVPVSFVSDHIETLYELDIQHRQIAVDLGFTRYERAPALNTRPDFIEALADLVARELKGP